MKWSSYALLATLALVGCAKQGGTKVDASAPAEKGIEVQAPGVDVEVKPGEGVKVEAPGVDVKTSPNDGPQIDVDGGAPK